MTNEVEFSWIYVYSDEPVPTIHDNKPERVALAYMCVSDYVIIIGQDSHFFHKEYREGTGYQDTRVKVDDGEIFSYTWEADSEPGSNMLFGGTDIEGILGGDKLVVEVAIGVVRETDHLATFTTTSWESAKQEYCDKKGSSE